MFFLYIKAFFRHALGSINREDLHGSGSGNRLV